VKFQGCKFENDISYGVMGEGIHSVDAIYEVTKSNSKGCEFKNLDKGISAYNPNRLRQVYVFDSKFNNNHAGITLSSADGAYFGRNTFTITGYANSQAQYGIYLNDCKNYTANSNTITSNSQQGSYGIYASYSGNGAHRIFRNTFENLHAAILPQFDNSGLTNQNDGLTINCNVFNAGTSNLADIAMLGVSGGNNINIPTVAYWQGVLNTSSPIKVRNQYGATCTGSSSQNKWAINTAQKIVKHPANNSPTSMMPTPQPNCSNIQVQLSTGPAFNFASQCLEAEANAAGIPISASNLVSSVSAARATVQSLQEVWNDSLDNGNSEVLLAQIASATLTALEKTTLMLQASPYVNDNILIAFFSNTDIGAARALAVHNVNAPVTSSVWSAITARSWNSTVQATFDSQQQANNSSLRDVLESELTNAKAGLQSVTAEKVRYFMADTLEHAMDTVIKILSESALVDLPLAKVKLAQAYLDAGYITRAFSYADSLKEEDGYEEIMAFQLNLMKLDTSSKRLWSLLENETLLHYFETLAPDTTKPGAWQARALLNYINNTKMNFTFLYPELGGERAAAQAEATQGGETIKELAAQKGFAFNLFPNPAGNSLTLYRSGGALTANHIEIVSVVGKIVKNISLTESKQQEVNTSDLASGMYFVNLYYGDNLIVGKKLFIAH
jgi:hypothetical protein